MTLGEALLKSRKYGSKHVIWGTVFLLVFSGSTFTWITYDQVNVSLYRTNLHVISFQIRDTTVLPPSANIRLIGQVDNPTSLDLYVSGRVDYYTNGVLITSFTIDNQLVNANTESTINLDSNVSAGSLIEIIAGGGERQLTMAT